MTYPLGEPAGEVPIPPGPTARRRPRWLLPAAIVAALLLVGVTVVTLGIVTSREDPGVTACKMSAESARTGVALTKVDSDRAIDLLRQSGHENLRRVGARLATISQTSTDESPFADLRDVMTIAAEYTSACAQHGVVIDLSNTPD